MVKVGELDCNVHLRATSESLRYQKVFFDTDNPPSYTKNAIVKRRFMATFISHFVAFADF